MEHSRFGYSAINDFKSCPFKYDLNWNKHIEVLDDYEAADALKVGTALHRAIETDFETAESEYYAQFPVITDAQITEMMKVEIQSKKVKELIEASGNKLFHETKISYGDFIGTIDLLELVKEPMSMEEKDDICSKCRRYDNCDYCQSGRCPYGKYPEDDKVHFNMYDFKYTNYSDNYKESIQLMVYKHFFEKIHSYSKYVIDKMYFIIVPKTNIKQGQDDLWTYRQKIIADLKGKEPILIESVFDEQKLQEYFKTVEEIKNASAFPKQKNQFCFWCKYKDYCERGTDFMILPSSERRPVGNPTKRKIWIYGASMSGKTTFLDAAPNPLNLNTDGNIQFVTMPYIPIKDEVTVTGRITERKFAWEFFKEAIAELEKKQNDFKTIIVDLVEDTREMCRLYKYDELGIQHESDSGYGKGWDIIKTEYLSVIRRLFNLDYENIIVVSHEAVSEVKKKNGQTITKIEPNIQDKVATKIQGMVDIVARVVVEDDGTRTLNFKSNEYIFGGGRLKNLQTTQIPLDWDELMKVYDCKSETTKPVRNDSDASQTPNNRPKFEPVAEGEELLDKPEPIEEEKSRTRRSRTNIEEPVAETVEEPAPQEEAPKRRTRKSRV